MSVLLWAVPPELIRMLGGKETAKEAWDTQIMRAGVKRVREAKAQTRRTQFENLVFKDGEGVESFDIRITAIVNILLRQLDKNDCEIVIERGVLYIFDRARKVLARVSSTRNRLYTLNLSLAVPVS